MGMKPKHEKEADAGWNLDESKRKLKQLPTKK